MNKWIATCAAAGLLALGMPLAAQTAQTTTQTQSDTAKEHAKKAGKKTKEAGKDAADAAKEAGKATAEGTKSVGEKLKNALHVQTTDAPKGATAQCNDGTWTKVKSEAKACKGAHKGVKAVVCPGALCGS